MPGHALTDEQIAFVTSGVSITAGSRDLRRVPSVVKALAVEVEAGGREVRLLVEAVAARQLLQDVAATAAITVVCSQPSTHHTLQLKGNDARVAGERPGDRELVERHGRAFADDLIPLGYAHGFAWAVHGIEPGAELAAVLFAVDGVYAQTPGPGAGARIGGGR